MGKDDGEFLTVRDAMQVLGVSKPTIYSLIARGKLKKYRRAIGAGVGGTRTYLKRAEVEALKGAPVEQK